MELQRTGSLTKNARKLKERNSSWENAGLRRKPAHVGNMLTSFPGFLNYHTAEVTV